MITLQFGASNTLLSWVVRAGTGSPWSHVDFVLPDGKLLGAIAGKGVQVHSYPQDRAVLLHVNAPASVLDVALSQVGKPYDWGGAVGAGFSRDWQDERRWFCSELVMWAFAQSGVNLLRTCDHGRITPGMLALSPLLRDMHQPERMKARAGPPPQWWTFGV